MLIESMAWWLRQVLLESGSDQLCCTWWLLSSQHFSNIHLLGQITLWHFCDARCSLCSFRLPGSPGRSAEIFGQSPEDMLFDWEQSGWVGKLTHFESTNNHFLSTRCSSTPTKKNDQQKREGNGHKGTTWRNPENWWKLKSFAKTIGVALQSLYSFVYDRKLLTWKRHTSTSLSAPILALFGPEIKVLWVPNTLAARFHPVNLLSCFGSFMLRSSRPQKSGDTTGGSEGPARPCQTLPFLSPHFAERSRGWQLDLPKHLAAEDRVLLWKY